MRKADVLVVGITVLAVVLAIPITTAAQQHQDEWLAFGVLEDLALTETENRTQKGNLQLLTAGIAGVAWGLVVYSLLPEVPQYAWTSGIMVAGISAIPAIFTLTRPSAAERALESIEKRPQEQWEWRSADALYDLADQAQRQRVMQAIRHGATGVAALAMNWPYLGMYNLGMVGYALYFPSLPEKALARYERLTQPDGGE